MPANEQQAEAWNGPESLHFVEHADRYDLQLEPFTHALLARALPEAGEVVLDVGCGSGATTLAVAGRAERVTGLDLSRPLVELAMRRARAANVGNADFVIADAQTYDFTPETFDLLISQFGLMFFDDPARALANIRRAMRPGGRAVFVSWQELPTNEWLMLIGEAVGRYVELPEFGTQARGPGMFSLCDADEITSLLGAAGFERVECESCTPKILIGGGGSLDESIAFLLRTGMARGLLGLVDPTTQAEVVRTVSAELGDRYEEGAGTRVGAAAWVVTART
jgi:ubiquinone/menaquinone biosynthesis C-methylase UbiE